MTWHSPGLEDMPQSSDHSEAVVAEGRQTCREARLGYAQGQVDKRRDVAPCHVKGCFSVLCGALPGSTPLPIDGGNRGSFIVPDPFLPTDVIHRQSTTFPSNPKSAYRVIRSTRPNLSSSLAKHTLEPHRATDAPIKPHGNATGQEEPQLPCHIIPPSHAHQPLETPGQPAAFDDVRLLPHMGAGDGAHRLPSSRVHHWSYLLPQRRRGTAKCCIILNTSSSSIISIINPKPHLYSLGPSSFIGVPSLRVCSRFSPGLLFGPSLPATSAGQASPPSAQAVNLTDAWPRSASRGWYVDAYHSPDTSGIRWSGGEASIQPPLRLSARRREWLWPRWNPACFYG